MAAAAGMRAKQTLRSSSTGDFEALAQSGGEGLQVDTIDTTETPGRLWLRTKTPQLKVRFPLCLSLQILTPQLEVGM